MTRRWLHDRSAARAAAACGALLIVGAAAIQLFVAPPLAPRINVRWSASVSDTDRHGLEQRFHLGAGESAGGTTWSYDLVDTSSTNIRALISDGRVEDTHHIDRGSAAVSRDAAPGTTRLPSSGLVALRDSAAVQWAAFGGVLLLLAAGMWRSTGRDDSGLRIRWRVPDVRLLAIVAPSSVVIALAGWDWQGWTAVPIALRFLTGVIAFGISPGFLIAGPWVARRRGDMGPADFIISVFTCSFSCNLVFNILLFILKTSFRTLAWDYLLLQLGGYAVWAVAWIATRRRVATRRAESAGDGATLELTRPVLAVGVMLVATAAALVYIAYATGARSVNPEEVVSLRKLAENPVVRYDNITFRNGDPSTYLFVPFQILVVGATLVGHLDVALTYSLFWGVVTALSIAMITRLAYVLFGRTDVAAIVCAVIVALGLFDPRSMMYDAGLVMPFPTRYGFAGGVLMPLILLLFWSILRDPRTHLWRWALLAYLVVETTFVHARETILAMGAMLVVFLLLAIRPRRHRAQLARIAGVLVLMAVVLVAYKYVNLRLASRLDSYVASLTTASRDAAASLVRQHGRMQAFLLPAPDAVVARGQGVEVSSPVGRYSDLFVESWQPSESLDRPSYLGRLYLPLVLLALPVYALYATTLAELGLALLLVSLAIVTQSGLLELSLSALVGNPEIFLAYDIVFLTSLLLFADMAVGAGHAIARDDTRSNQPRVLVIAGTVIALSASFALAWHLADWRVAVASYWGTGFTWALIAATLLAAGVRIWTKDLPLFSDSTPRKTSALAFLIALSISAVVLMPAVRDSIVWKNDPFTPEYPSSRFSGDFLTDYGLLDASNRLDPAVYPVDVVRFLREGLPPNQTILSADTLALSMTAPHFVPIISIGGQVGPSYVPNWDFLQRFDLGRKAFAVLPYLADSHGVMLFKDLIDDLNVDAVVVDPSEAEEVERAVARDPSIRSVLQPVFRADGFTVYRTIRPLPR